MRVLFISPFREVRPDIVHTQGTTPFALVATYARWKGQDLLLRAAACRAGGAVELFDDGVTALGLGSENAAELANAMLRVTREPALAERLALAGRHALTHFARARLGPELMALYEGALGGSGL